MPPHRKKPFSNKQKKEQLRAKRERKQKEQQDDGKTSESQAAAKDEKLSSTDVYKSNQQPAKKQFDDVNRYRLHFQKDTNEDVECGKRFAREPLTSSAEETLEMSMDDVYPAGTNLDMPKRPPWSYSMSREEVERREDKYFKAYVDNLFREFGESRQLSYVELNLETWRQLWRVIEMSDIVLLIADIRCPMVHFCPALYNYVVNETKKHCILVLNKVDVAPVELVTAWKVYFKEKYPQLHVVCFTSRSRDVCSAGSDPGSVLQKRKHVVRMQSAVGPRQLLECCEMISAGAVDLTSWRTKIADDSGGSQTGDECEVQSYEVVSDNWHQQQQQQRLFDGGILTVGCCGYPNVGKSSLINGLMGKKVVSVSRTPGHTKHFQTIFLTKNVRLCDSPGLVFPSVVARPLQILAGIYPIAQLREPYSAVRYLAERIPVIQLLQLKSPEWSEDATARWTAFDICDAWALKRGFLTAKAARPDVYRAANNILRMALEGRLCLCFRPLHYTARQDEWRYHSYTVELLNLLRISADDAKQNESENDDESLSASDSEQLDDEDEGSAAAAAGADNNDDFDVDDDDDVCGGVALTSTNPFDLLSNDN